MNKEELLEALKKIPTNGDSEVNHEEADFLIIKFINDPEITTEYGRINKWYA